MAYYPYLPLDGVHQETRLLTLQPDAIITSPLIGTISHVALKAPSEINTTRLTLPELRKTLPSGWSVGETLEGRFLFWIAETEQSFWTHPCPSFDWALYEGYTEELPIEFAPRFEALSYVWGDSTQDPDTLELRREAGQAGTEILITHNLGMALRHLRHPTEEGALWVDAVCIDQSNIRERNEQVPRMGLIYKLASRVVIWAGPSADNSSLALSSLDSIGREVEITKSEWFLPSPGVLDFDEDGWRNWPRYPPFSIAWADVTWAAVDALFKRPWFTRVWVIQEAVLSNRHSVFQFGFLEPSAGSRHSH
jgi:hypothetical protein